MKKSLDLNKCLRRSNRNKDRISSLPDETLLLIVSFLSFKEVVKTSILSRRWLNLWVHTPVLDIPVNSRGRTPVPKDQASFPITGIERREYIEWVNHVLRRHKCPHLEQFKIVCHLDNSNQNDIERWLFFAFSKNVERLELNLLGSVVSLKDNFVLPGWFLDFNGVNAILDGGKSRFVQFDHKCLKSLTLKQVDVTGEGINSILLNCPFLEQLEMVSNYKLVNLVISNPNLLLKYLKIKYCYNLEVLTISNINLVSLEIPASICLTLTNLPMLVELSIPGSWEGLFLFISRAYSWFSQLEALTLIGINIEDAFALSNNHRFTKLKRLVILGNVYRDQSLIMLTSIINYFPQLEHFVMKLSGFKFELFTNNEVEKRRSFLISKSLKVFEFFGYYGRDRDDELIMHVVDNAVGLEKIIIHLTGISTTIEESGEADRNIALQQLDSLKTSIPPHLHLLIH